MGSLPARQCRSDGYLFGQVDYCQSLVGCSGISKLPQSRGVKSSPPAGRAGALSSPGKVLGAVCPGKVLGAVCPGMATCPNRFRRVRPYILAGSSDKSSGRNLKSLAQVFDLSDIQVSFSTHNF